MTCLLLLTLLSCIPQAKVFKEQKLVGRCDLKLDFHDYGVIAVEHCANVTLALDTTSSTSLEKHVEKAQEYHDSLSSTTVIETYVIHWTTLKNGETLKATGKTGKASKDTTIQYWFSDDPARLKLKPTTVKTVYVYHDALFSNVEIVTHNKTIPIVLDRPLFPLQTETSEKTAEVPLSGLWACSVGIMCC